jgi:hypothetical protein
MFEFINFSILLLLLDALSPYHAVGLLETPATTTIVHWFLLSFSPLLSSSALSLGFMAGQSADGKKNIQTKWENDQSDPADGLIEPVLLWRMSGLWNGVVKHGNRPSFGCISMGQKLEYGKWS